MSLKENIDVLKQEISTEEKMLESMIKIEGFWKKYRIIIISVLAMAIISIVGVSGYNYFKEQQTIEASNLYTKLLTAPKTEDEEKLKRSNPDLYNMYLFQKAIKENSIEGLSSFQSDNELLNSIAKYQISSIKGSSDALNSYMASSKTPLKDFAILQEAYLLMKEGKLEEAKKSIGMISFDSPLKNVADFLLHYSAKGAS